MATEKDVVIAVLATFCLTSTLFMILPTRSQSDDLEYDPWADLNEDGIIDIYDVVGVTGIYETTGDPTKNVNVTNWPEYMAGAEKEWAFFNYKYGARPVVYSKGPYGSYGTTSTTPETILTFSDIDGSLYASNLSKTPVSTRLECEVWSVGGGHFIEVVFALNGIPYYSGWIGTDSGWQSKVLFSLSLNTSKTDNSVVIQFHSNTGTVVYIRNIYLKLVYDYSKLELTSDDFGFSKLYLRTLILEPDSAIRLNRNPSQVITNPALSTVKYELEGVPFSNIEFLCGYPEITVYAENP